MLIGELARSRRGEATSAGPGHIRWAMGYRNMTTFSAVRIPIRMEKGTMVKRRRAAVRYLRWVIARRVYRDPARPRARNVYCRTWIGPLPTSIVEPVYFP